MELEQSLLELIDLIREDAPRRGGWPLPSVDRGSGNFYVFTISLARFQSYRRRTEAALVQELTDYVNETGVSYIEWEIVDVDVHLW